MSNSNDQVAQQEAYPDDNNIIEVEPNEKKKNGRTMSDFWSYFTITENPYKLKSAKCKNCNQVVNYHKKSENAMRHLNNHCPPFKKLMNGMELNDRPGWYKG